MDRLLEIGAAAADVAEDTVENDFHTKRVGRVAQRTEIVLCAEHGIDALIIAGIIPVCRPGVENRIEIQKLHAERIQIWKLFTDAVQISAVEVVIEHLAVGVRQIDRYVVLVLVHPIGLDFPGQIAGSGLIKAIREDLIHDRARAVVRDGKFVLQNAELPESALLHICVAFALLEQAERTVLRGDVEVIEIQPGLKHGQLSAPGIIERIV